MSQQTPEQIPGPRVTDKMRAALVAAASDEHGWIPIGTAGRVLGELYKSGLARRSEPSEIPEITEAGREYVAQVNRAPMPAPEQIPANRERTARQLEYAINRMAGRYADAVSASLLAANESEVAKQTRARFRRHAALLRLTRALANLAVGA